MARSRSTSRVFLISVHLRDDDGGAAPYAKHDAEQIARGLNMLVQYGLEQLPNVRDPDLED